MAMLMTAITSYAAAQDAVPIENGTVTVCDGLFIDDGAGGGPYSTTNNYTFTICPDNPGDVISVQFVAFALYTNPNPNNSDYLAIFDGDSPAANSLGSYTGTSLQNTPVTGTVNNTSGCLTFVFNPNPNGNVNGAFPGWAANITCTTPCDNPTAAYEFVEPTPLGNDPTVGVCIEQTVTVADAGSTPAPGFNIENYIWNWGDSTQTITSDPGEVSHTYDEPGEYIVTLTVEDNNNCINLNLEPLQVLVSTIPIFNTIAPSPVCVGNPATLDGNPIQSITWTALPPQVVAGETFLADGAGFAYSTSLVFDFFPPGATLDDCDDLLSIFMNIEHSYMGDLEFFITCPNGTSVTMMSYPNGGGATYLGEAVDDNFDLVAPGVGYDYGWSPNSTAGFLNDAANWTMTTFTNAVGGVDVNNIANPGIYQSEEDLCNLVGCPLNGEWTFNVVDNLAADNGYIFYWGIDFNPVLLPDVTTFTPIIGLQADSSFWEGPNIINTSADGNTIDVLFTETGFYDYTFFATNNFGCTFDTTVTIEAVVGPEITAGPDLFVCDEPVVIEAGLASNDDAECGDDSGTYTYCYGNNENMVVTFCPDNPGDGVTFMGITISEGTIENFWDNFAVYDGDDITAPLIENVTGNLAGLSWEATNASGCITFQITSDGANSCEGGTQTPITMSVNCLSGGGLVWSWSPETGLSNPNVQNPSVLVDQTTVYTVTAFPPDLPGCIITDQVVVAPDPGVDPGLDTDTIVCYNSPQTLLINYLQGTPAPGGEWLNVNTGNPVPPQFNPLDHPNGASFTYTYTLDNGVCEKTSTLNLTVLPATDENCCLTNAAAGDDAVACDLVYQLEAFPTIGTGTWTGPENVTFSNVNDPNATVTCTSPGGVVTLTWTDTVDALCEASDEVTITFADPLVINLVPNDAICHNECSGTAIAIPSGGTPDGNGVYNYIWSSGSAGPTGQVIEELCAGEHQVLVVDNVGCADSLEFSIGEPPAQQLTTFTAPPLCNGECNGRVTMVSPTAVDYSYDEGMTFVSENEGELCAGEHVVIARDGAGCQIQTTVTLIDPPLFQATFNINPNPTTIRNTLVSFQNTSTPGPLESTLFLFGENGEVGESTERFTEFAFPTDTSGTYLITLITSNVNGCTDTLTRSLRINDDLLWFIPNAFSPNQDGINEVWKPEGEYIDLTNYRLEVFDRWGKRVFFTTDFKEAWNGSTNGSAYFAEMGVYTYIIRVESITTEETHEITGFVTLIR